MEWFLNSFNTKFLNSINQKKIVWVLKWGLKWGKRIKYYFSQFCCQNVNIAVGCWCGAGPFYFFLKTSCRGLVRLHVYQYLMYTDINWEWNLRAFITWFIFIQSLFLIDFYWNCNRKFGNFLFTENFQFCSHLLFIMTRHFSNSSRQIMDLAKQIHTFLCYTPILFKWQPFLILRLKALYVKITNGY